MKKESPQLSFGAEAKPLNKKEVRDKLKNEYRREKILLDKIFLSEVKNDSLKQKVYLLSSAKDKDLLSTPQMTGSTTSRPCQQAPNGNINDNKKYQNPTPVGGFFCW